MSIRVAIAGVGNCASSLVQGVEYYKDTKDEDKIPGLMHNNFGGYRVRDIEFVAAFDVDALKVGKDLSEAIEASQNNTIKFADVPNLGVEVLRGPTNDGLGEYYRQMIEESDAEPVDVAQVLRDKKVDVLVSYLPVGSEQADKAYAQAAMDAGCAFVNCGATITHRVLARLFEDRGVRLDRTYQLNVGGNMDFMNMLQRSRLESKKISKTRAVTSVVPHDMDPHNVHIGPSDYVAWLDDRKFAFVRLEGTTFGDVPLSLEYKLQVWDSPNSAGIVIDAVRAAKIALDRHLAGPILAPSSYFMKSPAVQHEDGEARRLVEEFIKGEVEGSEEQLDADVAAAKAAGKDVWRA